MLVTNVAAAGNPPIHVTLAIPIAGFYFDRYMWGKFYQDATQPGARLVDAFDSERERLAVHLGSSDFETEFDFDKRSYLYEGADIGEALGVELPVTRATVEVMGAMLQRDCWAEGLDLADIGLDGLDLEGVRRFVASGRR